MRLRWSVPGALIAGLYAVSACFLASREAIGNGCMVVAFYVSDPDTPFLDPI